MTAENALWWLSSIIGGVLLVAVVYLGAFLMDEYHERLVKVIDTLKIGLALAVLFGLAAFAAYCACIVVMG